MRDLTKGSVTGHLLSMAAFIAFTMLVQTAYFLVDLYFVSRLGKEAVAGVSAAGNLMLLTLALSQAVAVGVTALAARAIGAKNNADAELVFNQGMALALLMGAGALLFGYTAGMPLISGLTADEGSAAAARSYLAAFLPTLALSFPAAALGSALRAAGAVRGPTLVQSGSILLNIVLAPVLIAGWGTGAPLGVAGAGIASSIAALAGLAAMIVIFPREQRLMRWRPALAAPRLAEQAKILRIGLPSAFEFLLMFVMSAVVYLVIRDFGSAAQAGFGVGSRTMQSIVLPAMAIAFSTAPIVGQNLGAGEKARVRQTLVSALALSTVLMLALSILMHVSPSALTRPFSPDAEVLAEANRYLQIISWNMIAMGIVFTCSGVFQGLGDTTPSLISSASRLATFVAPALWLRGREGVSLDDFWTLSVFSQILQAALSLFLMRRVLRRRLA